MRYAGDITPQDAWTLLAEDPDSVLVDVRTAAEWQFVGVPVLDQIGKRAILVEWIGFPDGAQNQHFVEQVSQAVGAGDTQIVFLCRSGARSMGAASALTLAGYPRCYNILEGFEGDKDAAGHRGAVNGWKVAGLPWAQG